MSDQTDMSKYMSNILRLGWKQLRQIELISGKPDSTILSLANR